MTVKLTRVEAKRAFSSARLFSTKICNHLGDKTLDVLCILKSQGLMIFNPEIPGLKKTPRIAIPTNNFSKI